MNQRTYRCAYCCDSGYTPVWRPSAMSAYRADPDKFKPASVAHRFYMPCCCDKGEKIAPDEMHFNPGRHPRQINELYGVAPEGDDRDFQAMSLVESLVNWRNYMPEPVAEEFDVRNYQFKD